MAKRVDHHEDPNPTRRNRHRSSGGGKTSWALANPELVMYAVMAVAQRGGALRLGYTRDGGAYAIGVYGDGEPYTDYVSPNEDINQYLRNLAEDFGNVQGDGSLI